MPRQGKKRPAAPGEKESLFAELTALRAELVNEAEKCRPLLDAVHVNYTQSARNLLHYLALRRRDLRPLQQRLAALGLSSLGRAESHVLATLDAVLDTLAQLTKPAAKRAHEDPPQWNFSEGANLLACHTECLLGPPTPGREVRIMVTMPSEAATDYTLIHTLLRQGMDCMRINCAHDDEDAWRRMIEHLRRAEQALGRSCRVVMDLGGPKLRTGEIEAGPAVLRIRPSRSVFGRVVAPARIWLTADCNPHPPPSPAYACLEVSAHWLARLHTGQRIKFVDARDSRLSMTIVDVTGPGCWAELGKTAYLVPDTVLRCEGKQDDKGSFETRVGPVPPGAAELVVHRGDLLILGRDGLPGRAATFDSAGRILTPATIGCTLPEVLDDVRPGESIWFDDGRIGGVIERVEDDQASIRITHALPGGSKLRGDKGINLPESTLTLSALSDKDIEDLSFITRHADVVELSFAGSVEDVGRLLAHLEGQQGPQPAVVLKIETRRGFENLPGMLLAAMRTPCCGVMIARGDLAVECGFERLAEVQEEILWICEAAHVPVIWATQVLETLAKKGMPSRAEITDAAMGHRAECVMLNKGPHVVTAVQLLDGILRRMQAHQTKKRAMLRALKLAFSLPGEP